MRPAPELVFVVQDTERERRAASHHQMTETAQPGDKAGRLSKRQRRRRRKPATAAAKGVVDGDLPPSLGEKLAKAESAVARQNPDPR